jgi:hypothetical protein
MVTNVTLLKPSRPRPSRCGEGSRKWPGGGSKQMKHVEDAVLFIDK